MPTKRRLEVNQDASMIFTRRGILHTSSLTFIIDAVYKASKLNANGDVKTNGQSTVKDEGNLDEIEAGPELPPDNDLQPDDEDDRFFGGGVTRNTADVLDFIEQRDKDDMVRVRHQLLEFC